MKRIINKFGVIALILSLGATSCKESFLDAVPETNLPDVASFENASRVLSQVNGLYGSAKSGRLYGGRYQIYNDIRAEEFINRTNNTVTGYTTYQGTQDPSDTYIGGFWEQGYLTINRINLFLEGVDANPGIVSAELANQYKAEAKFLRAYTYFGLLQFFAKPYILDNGASPGLPLRLKGETSTENNDLARSSVAEIYNQIIKDLTEAEAALPDTYGTPALRTSRAHKNTAVALKTRVLLTKGDYASVITEANKIVSAGAPFTSPTRVAHALVADVVTAFRTPYTTSENILSFPMTNDDAPGTQNQIGYYFNVGNLEYFLNAGPTSILSNAQFTATDVRRTSFIAMYAGIGPHSVKFSGVSPFIDWVPQIRYAEILLNLAEAEAEVGDQARAKALLEAVHHRSNPDYAFGTLDKAALIQAILTERRIEFLGEGFRANDIVRRGQPINSFGAGTMIQPTDGRYIFAIPVPETQTNKDI